MDRIEGTADSVPGTGTYWRYGRVNAAAAVAATPLLRASPATLPFGSAITTISWNTAAGPGQVWASNNGGPESLFAQGAAGSQDASFIVSGSYTFKLYAGTTRTTSLAPPVTVTKQNPKGTTGPAILVQPSSFAFQPGVILNTATVQFDSGNDTVGDVYVRLNNGPDALVTENVIGGQVVSWIQSGTYTFTLKSKADGKAVDTATVTTGAGLAASPTNLSGGSSPQGAATQTTYNSGNGMPAVECVANPVTGISTPISYSNSGAGIEALHLATGAYTVTLYVSAGGTPITVTAPGTGGCTANVPLMPAPGVQSVTIAVAP